jgi:plasmid stability protein
MNEVVVSGLDDVTFERLRRRAVGHGWPVEEEVKYLLTRGLDALEYAEQAFRVMNEATCRRPQPHFDVAAHRARIEQMLQEASNRDANALEELDQDIEAMRRLVERKQ